jgi:hypothetical protein
LPSSELQVCLHFEEETEDFVTEDEHDVQKEEK